MKCNSYMIPGYFVIKLRSWNITHKNCNINSVKKRIYPSQTYKIQINQNSNRKICKNKEEKEKKGIKMDTRRSFNKDDAQTSFATNASDNHPSETHVTVL